MRREARTLTRYGIVGIVNNLVLYLAFVALVWAGTGPLVSAGICYVAGVAMSYWLNRIWTFESTARHSREVPKFLTAYAIGFCATLVMLRILLIWLPPQLAQIFNIGLTAVVIYVSLRLLKFGKMQDAD
nr:GtrA family protein [Loktanella sp. M215]